ncbi:endonuclease 8-like 2 [Ambystoma mexicanum]|uniref:endonuclease 8-like 2 n=1 Tax=Ambystoma mexicanum TaxID=8296 RepID=UPI0037E7E4AD
MPEGPSVKKFYTLAFPFVGQLVTKAGGSTKKIDLKDLNQRYFQDCMVHGKNLFLAFGSDLRTPGNDRACDDLEAGSSTQDPKLSTGSDMMLQEKEQEVSDLRKLRSQASRKDANAFDGQAKGKDALKWLRFHFGMFGSVRANEFARAKQANKKGDWNVPAARLVLSFDDGGFLAFYNTRMDWVSRPFTRPTCDILSATFHRGQALEALRRSKPVCFTLLDQRYFSGLGNIIKNEILFFAGVHPLTPGSFLDHKTLESILDHALRFTSEWLHNKLQGKGMHHQIYLKETCPLGHQVMKDTLGPPGALKRLTWWCPECQPEILPKHTVHP